MRKMKKGALLLALAGTTLFGGCLGGWNWQRILWDTAMYAGQEYLLDNNGVFNIFSTDDTN
ncbi:MAG: hypothetical protein V1790_18570 [Planctomycetota bacterium]